MFYNFIQTVINQKIIYNVHIFEKGKVILLCSKNKPNLQENIIENYNFYSSY